MTVDSVAAVAAGVAAGAQQLDECMGDIGDLMADMFGAVAVAIDGQAQGGPRAVVAARRRQRELDEQAQRSRERDLASTAAAAAQDIAPSVGPAAALGRDAVAGALSPTPRAPSNPSDRVVPGCAARRVLCVFWLVDCVGDTRRPLRFLTLACLPRSCSQCSGPGARL
eukprot:COSAG03_NODE_3540_length_1959_cov_2.626344_2_plen_168_part_00